ncbi:malto-oligosyltrehalose trehalohydrolase [Sagittula salina]|uniref:Malto-oligosyltrehalose trehalohydrolase n=1 Tax=Sagittula salina TaxID=2820268 RepID=A0A940MI42_9RHOB|nr:malto-oligosyltrehalose trehalohydrolase [Sagittula salina]MBP0482170.1 malto-oligosyltrehalose trehalohydrolase [Sagittula salina]
MSAALWGARPLEADRWRFALWAPSAREVMLQLDGTDHAMTRDAGGHWQTDVTARDGLPYVFRVDGEDRPDPLSRHQQGGPLSPSLTVDARRFDWGAPWDGRPLHDAVIFELHVGSFTTEGTFTAAARRLPDLAALGITCVELMPVSQFEGARGWGYDGVLIAAPHPAYGTPDELRAFVRQAQELGMMVLLDLVMNHFGPFGNALPAYAPEFFSDTHTPWGGGIDFAKLPVQAFFREAAVSWLKDYRLDGFRLDAVHEIRDGQDQRFLRDLAVKLREEVRDRPIHLICEDERNLTHLRENGFDAEWNDDWHNALHVALTGETQGYYDRFAADPFGDIAHALARGQVDEGQSRPARNGDGPDGYLPPRGAPAAHLPWTAFVNANLTHDQAGNRPEGRRLISLVGEDPARTVHAALLLMPFVPMLFMGEEEGSTTPFHFFCDPPTDDGRDAVRKGRARELSAIGYDTSNIPDPCAVATMEACRPYPAPDPARAEDWRALTRQLTQIRAAKIVPLLASGKIGEGDVSRHGRAFEVRWPFNAGRLHMRLSLGDPLPGPALEAPDFRLGQPGHDSFSIEVQIT